MSSVRAGVHDRAAALRRDFDHAFMQPVQFERPPVETLLAIRVGGEACALRLTEIAGVFVDRQITRVPGSAASLIGLAGFRGAIVPVYGLQALLGFGGAKTAASMSTPRWLVLAAAESVALAFDVFDGQLRVSPDAILPADARSALGGCTREFLRSGDFAGPIVHLPSLLDAVAKRNGKAVAN